MLFIRRVSTAPYYIKEMKLIPKKSTLESLIYVKWVNFELPLGKVVGKRVVIAGTAKATAGKFSHIFFAVFNTYYNVTEFVWEEPHTSPEICRAVEIAATSDHCTTAKPFHSPFIVLIISDIFNASSIERTYLTSSTVPAPVWNVAVRAFSFSRISF